MTLDQLQSFLKSRQARLEVSMRRRSHDGAWFVEAKIHRYQSVDGKLKMTCIGTHADEKIEGAIEGAIDRANVFLYGSTLNP
jgi:hypothetical protein